MVQETEMAKKILGKKTETVKETTVKDYLSNEVLWNVTKEGCGTSVFTGTFAKAIMNADDKDKAMSGAKKIESSNGFTFERK